MKELRSQGQISQQNKLSFCFRKIPLPHGVWARGVWSLTHNVGSDGKVLAIRAVAFGGGTGCRVEKCSRGRTSKSISEFFSSVAQSCLSFAIPWTAACQASLSITGSQSLLKLISIESAIPSNHLILCHPFLPSSIFPYISVFPNESVLRIRWPKYWSFSFIISPPNEYSGLISFRIDWLNIPAVQGTLKSLLQHHSSKASILQHSAFFMVQLAHPYMTIGTNHSFD